MPPSPPAASSGGKKILGMKRSVAIPVLAAGGALLLTLGYLWWKGRAKKAASATTSTSTSASASALAQDYAGQLSVIQTELEEVLGQRGSATTSTTTKTSASTGTKTTTAAKPPKPTGLKVSGQHATSGQISWDLPGGNSGITWHVTNKQGGTITDQFTTNNTIANIGGSKSKLKPNTAQSFSVYGTNSAGTGPTSTLAWKTAK